MSDMAMDVLIPDGGDYLAMAVAFVVYFVLSFLWWGPLFGKTWARGMGMTMDPKNRPPMTVPMILQAVGTLLLAYVLWHVMEAFVVTHDGAELARGDLDVVNALIGAFFTWLGFFVPQQLGKVAWEKGTWPVFAINASGHLIGLAAMSLVFALM